MKTILRSLVLASAVLATAALTVKTAMASTTLNVPFAFTVDNQECPAGHYMVERSNDGSTVKLIGATKSFTWGIHPGDGAPSDTRIVLKFDELGSARALNTIQYGALTTSQIDKKSLNREANSTEIVLGR
ncbi:MAG TPA: hypothetical protein VL986_01680 [Terracidiphilus sp.]|nr:hypothetical protein [Terracidiphilus sp.]